MHLENPYASGETKRPRGPRPRSSLTLFSPTLDVHSRALAYYLNYYLHALTDLPTVSACMSECLTAWKASKRKCAMVDLAVSAVALGIFSRTQQHPAAAREACRSYDRLLRVAQEQITHVAILACDERGIDKFLLTIVLMAWYETIMHQPAHLKPKLSPSSLHSWAHHDGAMAMLKAWSEKPRGKHPSDIIKQSRRGLLRSALLRNRSLPVWVRDGSRFGECGLDLGFDGILVRVVNLRHALKSFERKQRFETTEAEHLSNEAQELDEACREWAVQLPGEWSFESINIPNSWPKSRFYSSTVTICARHGYAAVWLQYFAVQMLISSSLLRLLQLIRPTEAQAQAHDSTYQQEREYVTKLETMADSLASTIPFSVGRIKVDDKPEASDGRPTIICNADENIPPALALPIIWPLSVASSLDGVEPSQQLWFCAELGNLGRVLGDGALMCAGTDQWTHE